MNFWTKLGCLLPMVFSLCVLAMMANDVLVVGPGMDKEAAELEGLPGGTLESFKRASPNSRVAITATLIDNPLLEDDLVAYVRQVWSFYRDKNWEEWVDPQPNFPSLTVQLDGQTIRVQRSTSLDELGGSLHERVYAAPYDGRCRDYGDQCLSVGSLRFQGLANGDIVTVVGWRTSDGSILPARLYGGSRTELVDKLRRDAEFRRSLRGSLLMCATLWLAVPVIAVVSRIRTKRTAAVVPVGNN
jgi:hypothetical protein